MLHSMYITKSIYPFEDPFFRRSSCAPPCESRATLRRLRKRTSPGRDPDLSGFSWSRWQRTAAWWERKEVEDATVYLIYSLYIIHTYHACIIYLPHIYIYIHIHTYIYICIYVYNIDTWLKYRRGFKGAMAFEFFWWMWSSLAQHFILTQAKSTRTCRISSSRWWQVPRDSKPT